MANLKAVKKNMSKWGALGNAFLSVVLAVSLMPSYAAFGDDALEDNDTAAQQLANMQAQNDESDSVNGFESQETKNAEAKDYVYATADSSWLVEVSTASDMPADLMAGGSAAAVFTPLAGDELSAAESAVAAKWDGDLSGRVTAGRVSLSEGSIPADAKVTVTSLGRSANDAWAGYRLSGGGAFRQRRVRHEPDRADERLRLRARRRGPVRPRRAREDHRPVRAYC